MNCIKGNASIISHPLSCFPQGGKASCDGKVVLKVL